MSFSKFLITSIAISGVTMMHIPDSQAQEPVSPETSIENCLQSGTGVPTQLHHDLCIDAANLAWTEATKTELHSMQRQQLYWMQAFEASNMAMLTQVKIDQDMTARSCQIAKFGLQCFNQVDPEGPMKSVYRKPEAMINFYQNCETKGFYKD